MEQIITKGCFKGLGYHPGGPFKCYPIEYNGELQTEPHEGAAYCAALACPFNPPDLSKD